MIPCPLIPPLHLRSANRQCSVHTVVRLLFHRVIRGRSTADVNADAMGLARQLAGSLQEQLLQATNREARQADETRKAQEEATARELRVRSPSLYLLARPPRFFQIEIEVYLYTTLIASQPYYPMGVC